LKDACPVHARRELKRDCDAIIHADDGLAARKAQKVFLNQWEKLCPAAMARSYEDAGDQLLTFFEFQEPM
jgi:transposase-like protein